MKEYNHKKIEPKWRKEWAKKKIYKTADPETGKKPEKSAPKSYVLDMFPYPSGEGLHVGHPKGYIATDIYARFKKMSGFNVLHAMGWDAFGLPAENYAIKHKIHPRIAVEKNIARYKEQLSLIGLNYDWSREIDTTDPEYYKWTQWIFLKMFEKGLAFQSYEPINWCPSCQTGLANEDLEDGKCERCGSEVQKKPMRQWVLRITDYAEQLLADLEPLNWPESIKESQRNWIGKSEGAEINFPLEFEHMRGENSVVALGVNTPRSVSVFTTRPETIFGVVALVVAPEHELVFFSLDKKNPEVLQDADAVRTYVKNITQKTEIERTNARAEKTGVRMTGVWAINPATKEKVPVFVADYVLASHGTGAVMSVPAHDERDFQFAQKFSLPVKEVIVSNIVDAKKPPATEAYTGEGILINSSAFTGKNSADEKVVAEIIAFVGGKKVTTYKLRDWVFSRQRYWGEPIPVIHCEACGVVPVPEKDLPIKLPDVKNYTPTGTGESPLAAIEKWVNVACPHCRSKAKRETNTMPQWAGSCWYHLRFMDPQNSDYLVDSAKEKYWAPVDVYVGGAEHATRHLIYARFWHKFLNDIGVVTTSEPFARLHNVGLILAEDGRKMSKRFGNVINPDDIIELYGADTFRLHEMFMGPFDQSSSWDTQSIIGSRRFIERVWRLADKVALGKNEKKGKNSTASTDIDSILHTTIAKVTKDIETFSFNTAISSLMILSKEMENCTEILRSDFEMFIRLLAPFAPHVTDELWGEMGNKKSIHLAPWPQQDASKIKKSNATIIVQVNGKVRAEIGVEIDASEEAVTKLAKEHEIVKKWLSEGVIQRTVFVKNRLINFVVR